MRMCFRPPEATAPQICPECGKKCAVIAGIRQETCPFCGASLPAESETSLSTPDAPSAPGAPALSGAPAAPSAPKPVN